MARYVALEPRRANVHAVKLGGRRVTVPPVAVSNLAGQSPHVRVQYEMGGEWHRYATFREAESAVNCARQLTTEGYRVRLVSFSIAPAAG